MTSVKYPSGIPSLTAQSQRSTLNINADVSPSIFKHSSIDRNQNPAIMISGQAELSSNSHHETTLPSACSPLPESLDHKEVVRREFKEGHDDVFDATEIEASTSSTPSEHHHYDHCNKCMKASESYLESSPSLRSQRLSTRSSDQNPASASVEEHSSPRKSSSSSLGYKSKVQQLIVKMEEQQAQHFRDQHAKSLEFRKRMDQLISGDGSCSKQGENDIDTKTRDEVSMKGSYNKNCETKSPFKPGDQYLGPYDIAKTETQWTASTRSISASSWSIASASKDEEDHLGGSHGPLSGQQVHVPHSAVSTSQELSVDDPATASSPSLEDLLNRLQKLEFEMTGLESENVALRALRGSYKLRFADEQEERKQLLHQVALLKPALEDAKSMNDQLQTDLDESRIVQRKQRTQHLRKETEWKAKTDRVKRDLDKLWKEHKTSHSDLKESLQSIQELQSQLDGYRKRERRWEKERTFLKGKVKFLLLQGKITTYQTTLKTVREENGRSIQQSEERD